MEAAKKFLMVTAAVVAGIWLYNKITKMTSPAA